MREFCLILIFDESENYVVEKQVFSLNLHK